MSTTPWSGDPESLLVHAGWVRGLARRLAEDPARADDVEQEAWLDALGHPPAHASNLRAWLGRVVQNASRQLRRGEARRARREERAPSSSGAPSSAELVEQAEVHREVVGAALELAEPYRTTVLLRYWRGLEPGEIARAQGISAGTVRSRLHRAHAELREVLDRRFRGGRGAWSAVAMAGWCEGVEVAGAGSAPAWLTGGLAMGSKVWVAGACAVAVAAVVWWIGNGPSSAEAPDEEAPGGGAALAAEGRGFETGRTDEAGPAGRGERAPAEAADPIVLRGEVRASNGSPIAGASIQALGAGPPADAVTSDGGGLFRLELAQAPSGILQLAASADGYRPRGVDVVEPDGAIEIVLLRVPVVEGHVRDAKTGEPVAGARLVWRRDPSSTTDDSGYYRIEDPPVGSSMILYARAEGYAEEEAHLELDDPEGATVDFELRRGRRVVVQVFDRESGDPVADAEVYRDPHATPLGRTDAEGRYAVDLVDGFELYLEVRKEDYYGFVWGFEVEDSSRPLSPRIPLAPQAVVEGRVTDREGSGVAGARVIVREEGSRGSGAFGSWLTGEERERFDLPGMAGASIPYEDSKTPGRFGTIRFADDEGRFSIPVLPGPAQRRVSATHPDGPTAESESFVVESSQERTWRDVVLPSGGATVRGRVVFNGEARADESVRWTTPSGEVGGSARTDDNGFYRLEHVGPGDVRVELARSPESLIGAPEPLALRVEDGGVHDHDFVWSAELAEITGRVTSADGEPLAGLPAIAFQDDARAPSRFRFDTHTADDGTFAIEVRAGEPHAVRVGRAPFERTRTGVVGGAEPLEIVIGGIGIVPVQLVDAADGRPVQVRAVGCAIHWREAGTETFRSTWWSQLGLDGREELRLPAGVVDLSVDLSPQGFAPARVEGLRVAEGRRGEDLVVELRRGVEVRLALIGPEGGATLPEVDLFLLEASQQDLLRDPEGRPEVPDGVDGSHPWVTEAALLNQWLELDDRGRAHVAGLAPGTYSLRAVPDRLTFEPASFSVTGEEREPIEVRWRER